MDYQNQSTDQNSRNQELVGTDQMTNGTANMPRSAIGNNERSENDQEDMFRRSDGQHSSTSQNQNNRRENLQGEVSDQFDDIPETDNIQNESNRAPSLSTNETMGDEDRGGMDLDDNDTNDDEFGSEDLDDDGIANNDTDLADENEEFDSDNLDDGELDSGDRTMGDDDGEDILP